MADNHRRDSQSRRLHTASDYERLGNLLAATAALFFLVGTTMLVIVAVTGDPKQGGLITMLGLAFWGGAMPALGIAGFAYLQAGCIKRYGLIRR